MDRQEPEMSLGQIVYETTRPGPPREKRWEDVSAFDRAYYENIGQAIADALERRRARIPTTAGEC